MAIKKLVIKLKGAHGARGTEAADELVDMLKENWEQIQTKYNELTETEKNEMLEHFNSTFENIGDTLFGEEADFSAVDEYINGLNEEEKGKFCEQFHEALQIEH